jgi:TonB family protein
MVGVSAAAHAIILVLALVVLPALTPMPLPIVAYTVELTDPNALGGRLPPGPADRPIGARPGPVTSADPTVRKGAPDPEPAVPASEPTPDAATPPIEKVEPPKPAEPPPKAEPIPAKPRRPEEVQPLVKPAPPKPVPPKPVAAKPDAPKPDVAKAPPPNPEGERPQSPSSATKKAEPPKSPAAPAATAARPPSGQQSGKPDGKAADAGSAPDPYAALADKWRAKGATGGGGGVGGRDAGSGPIGAGGYGPGGGGQVVGIEFLAYQQRVVTVVKDAWVNAVARAGLVAKVRFRIAPTGVVSDVRLEQASGDATFDGSVLRAVQRANPLPAPPARHAAEFGDFVIEFHSEEAGGQGSG